EKLYGFKWTKNAVTHSYRHIQATYLQDSSVSEREILARIGHANRLTLSAYTHQSSKALDQTDSVKALDKITKELGLVS
ncbi:MAG: site-specific integrase, partial [Lactococcus raffinolactis]